jgi:pimeloyl-ACP methyl ester carboxylesterase
MQTERGVVSVEGGELEWDAMGAGDPIVLLHGFSVDRRSWKSEFSVLAARHRVVRYDLRGFGASSVPSGPGYREIAAQIAGTAPKAALFRMDNAGHMMNLERPAEFHSVMTQCMDHVQRSS